jgi:hypothetical protein
MRATDVMTRGVITATPEMTVQDVAKLMINHRISGIPIVDGNRQLVGIVTRRFAAPVRNRHRAPALALERVVFAELAIGGRIHQVPRQTTGRHHDARSPQRQRIGDSRRNRRSDGDKADQTRARRTRRQTRRDRQPCGSPESIGQRRGLSLVDDDRDRSICSRLLADLRKQKWANPNESDIIVSDGVVYFWGIVGSEEERRALRIAAENTPGVRGIEDHTISGPLRPGPLFP